MKKPFIYKRLKEDIIKQIKTEKLKSGDRILLENPLFFAEC